MTKQLKQAEEQLRELLEGQGWKVVHKGWPDFACIRDGEMMFVEVKGYKGEMLKKHQHFILTNLAKLGLKCYKWTPAGGFEQILGTTPFIEPPKKKELEPLTSEEIGLAFSYFKDNPKLWERFQVRNLKTQRWIIDHIRQGNQFYF